MNRYIEFNDAVKAMACEMYAEAQCQGYDVDGIEDFMPEAKAWLNDASSIDLDDYVPRDFHDKTCEAMAKRHQEEIANMVSVVRCSECKKSHIDGKTTHYLWCTEWGRSTDTFGYCERADRKE